MNEIMVQDGRVARFITPPISTSQALRRVRCCLKSALTMLETVSPKQLGGEDFVDFCTAELQVERAHGLLKIIRNSTQEITK